MYLLNQKFHIKFIILTPGWRQNDKNAYHERQSPKTHNAVP
jgi:hypothetical protein